VTIDCPTVPVSLPVKITIYRLIQEALNNAYRHAGGQGQQVTVRCSGELVTVDVADSGPGFAPADNLDTQEHLGLVGMRERVESLGGRFSVVSAPGAGTRVRAELAWGAQDER
jgi:signal transduction histidine kinase